MEPVKRAGRLVNMRLLLVISVILLLTGYCVIGTRLATLSLLQKARSEGVYATPEEGIRADTSRFYCGVKRIEIMQAGPNWPNGFNPHEWYVIYRVYADQRAPCDQHGGNQALHFGTYDEGGTFYFHLKDGWVHMRETLQTNWGITGLWIQWLGQAGPGNAPRVDRVP